MDTIKKPNLAGHTRTDIDINVEQNTKYTWNLVLSLLDAIHGKWQRLQHTETYNPPHSADHAQYALMTSYEQLRRMDPPTGWSGDTQHVLTLCLNKISLSTSKYIS